MNQNPYRNVTFVSFDVETDGPIPGPHSMIQLGAVALAGEDGRAFAEYASAIAPLPEAAPDPETLAWWRADRERAAKYAHLLAKGRPPAEVTAEFIAWFKQLPGDKVLVAYPAGFDFTFLYWYLIRFTGKSPTARSCLDVRSYGSALLNRPPREIKRVSADEAWLDLGELPHDALDDARAQGQLFLRMLEKRRALSASMVAPVPGVIERSCMLPWGWPRPGGDFDHVDIPDSTPCIVLEGGDDDAPLVEYVENGVRKRALIERQYLRTTPREVDEIGER